MKLGELITMEFADIEPLIIQYNGKEWIHPDIESYYAKDEGGYDNDMYRVYYKSGKSVLRIFFKSDYITTKMNNYFASEDRETKPKQTLFEEPYIDVKLVHDCMLVTLVEDVWSPGGEQFAFTKFGHRVGKFMMRKSTKMDFFSLDCALTTDGIDWWCDS